MTDATESTTKFVTLEDLEPIELEVTRRIYEEDKKLRVIFATGVKEDIKEAAVKAREASKEAAMDFMLANIIPSNPDGEDGKGDELYINSSVRQTVAVLAEVYFRVIVGHEKLEEINNLVDPSEEILVIKTKLKEYFEHLNSVQFSTEFGSLLKELAVNYLDEEYLAFDFSVSPNK